MESLPTSTRQEKNTDDKKIRQIHQEVFGPGRLARTAYRIREGFCHSLKLSFVTVLDSNLIASVRLTPIFIGTLPGLLLGPLAVSAKYKNMGVGKDLLRHSVNQSTQAGENFILLVGKEDYYGPIGFSVVQSSNVKNAWTI